MDQLAPAQKTVATAFPLSPFTALIHWFKNYKLQQACSSTAVKI